MNQLLGFFLIGESIASIVASQDQRSVSTLGRELRIIIGIYLLGKK